MPPALNVLGCGRLGTTLPRLLADAGSVRLAGLFSRQEANAENAREFVGAGRVAATLADLPDADLWLLAVPDGAIAGVAGQLAGLDRDWRGVTVFHCSGLHGSALLAPLAARGAHTASLHPAHSFGDRQKSLETFVGSVCTLEGGPGASALLGGIFSPLGVRMLPIEAGAKPLYHAATAVASNYLVSLVAAALAMLEKAGMADADARALLAPLVTQTAANVLALGPEAALTGPIARGDGDTVARHLAAIADRCPEYLPLYRALGLLTADIAEPGRPPGDDAIAHVRALLAPREP
ncbi:MAG: DUF2520 domain-containing protein [Porticoccaceae bacterium]|jgi:predicted short-subunit dehydrogenase-like oxidoreductase (DUF2520 family)|nr:DUF2520 domain-containing protein [Porticoccaceae bacterium]